MTSLPALALPAVDHRHHGHGRGVNDDQLPAVSFPAVESRGPWHTSRRRSSADWPASIVGTAGIVPRCQTPALALPGVDHRHHGHGRGGGPGAARSTMTSLPASAFRLSIDGHGGTCEPWGPCEPRHDDQLPGAGLGRRQLPAVDHRQTGRRRSSAPRARPRGRPRRCQVNDDQLAGAALAGVD